MVVAAYGLILPQDGSGSVSARVHQHPRLAAAALARRGADPACHPGRRHRTPASASCAWKRAWIPARCTCRRPSPSPPTTRPPPCTTSWRRSARLASCARSSWLRDGSLRPQPQAQDGCHLRAQDRQGGSRARLDARRSRARPAGAGLQSVSGRCDAPAGRNAAGVASAAACRAQQACPGRIRAVEADAMVVECGSGLLRIDELQRAGGRRLQVRELLARFADRARRAAGGASR